MINLCTRAQHTGACMSENICSSVALTKLARWFVDCGIMSTEMIAFLKSCDKNRLKPGDHFEGTFGPLVPNPKAKPGKKYVVFVPMPPAPLSKRRT